MTHRLKQWCRTTLAIAAMAWTQAAAAELPGISPIEDFEASGAFLFELDGRDLDAEIYHSEREVAYLIVATKLPAPLLISPRGKSVQTVEKTRFTRTDGGAELAEKAALEQLGEYELSGDEMVFEIGGKIAKLKPKPPLLGHQDFATLEEHDPKYAKNARTHGLKRKSAAQAPPVPGENVRVRVYFGSWSEICQYLVPKMKSLEEDWRSHGVQFEYYGVPKPITDDQHAVDTGILGVPTAVVFVDGEEIGRLSGRALDTPEESLTRLLGGEGPR